MEKITLTICFPEFEKYMLQREDSIKKITDLYATSADYNLDADETKDFFSTVQNMLLFSITGQTAAEIIKSRNDKNKLNIGLTTGEDAPHGKILQADVVISKNYLNETFFNN